MIVLELLFQEICETGKEAHERFDCIGESVSKHRNEMFTHWAEDTRFREIISSEFREILSKRNQHL